MQDFTEKNWKQQIAYTTFDPKDLLQRCKEMLDSAENQQDTLLRGTLSNEDKTKLLVNINIKDPNNLLIRYGKKAPIDVDSWSELFSLAVLGIYMEKKTKYKWDVGVGIESKYNSSEMRELFLGDGVIASPDIQAKQVCQECKVQNWFTSNTNTSIEEGLIQQINKKLSKESQRRKKYPTMPTNCLLVTVMSKESNERIDIKRVFDLTIGPTERSKIFDSVFCIFIEDNVEYVRVFRIDVAQFGLEAVKQESIDIRLK